MEPFSSTLVVTFFSPYLARTVGAVRNTVAVIRTGAMDLAIIERSCQRGRGVIRIRAVLINGASTARPIGAAVLEPEARLPVAEAYDSTPRRGVGDGLHPHLASTILLTVLYAGAGLLSRAMHLTHIKRHVVEHRREIFVFLGLSMRTNARLLATLLD